MVERAVPASRQPMHWTLGVAGGPLDRRGAVVGGEAIRGPEPADVTDLADDDRGDHVTDTEDLHQTGPRRANRGADARAGRRALGREMFELVEHLLREQVPFPL